MTRKCVPWALFFLLLTSGVEVEAKKLSFPLRSDYLGVSPHFILIGHRGASGTLPEHTLAAYKLAIKQKVNYIEPDIVATKDGVLVARHENDISETTDVAKKFPKRKRTKVIDGEKITGWFTEDFTLKELKRLWAKQPLSFRSQKYNQRYRIPTLEEILLLVKKHNKQFSRKIGLYIETKHPSYFRKIGLALEPRLLKLLKKHGFAAKGSLVFIQSFEVSNLQWLKKRTSLPLIQLLYKPKEKPYDFVLRKDKRTYADLATPKGLRFIATYAKGIGVWKGLILKAGDIPALAHVTPLIYQAHKQGLLVHAYTFRDEARYIPKFFRGGAMAEYHFFLRIGIDGMFTDFPSTFHKALTYYSP